MASTVTIGGKQIKKSTVAIAGGGFGLVGFLWWRHNKSAASSTTSSSAPGSTSATDQYPADGTVGDPSDLYSTDPATGMTYGDEASTGFSDYGGLGSAYGAGAVSPYYGAGTATGSLLGNPGSFTSNAQWAQYVEQQLDNSGIDPTSLSAAIGKYLTGQAMTTDQGDLVDQAIAIGGYPPVSGPSGYPPAMNISVTTSTSTAGSTSTNTGSGSGSSSSGSSSGSSTGSSSGTPITTPGGNPPPDVSPPPAKGGPITVTPDNLHVTNLYSNSVRVAWSAPSIPSGQGPLTGYTAQVFNSNGSAEGTPWTVSPNQLFANAGGLKSKTSYHINVWCDPARTGGPHASVSFTTT